MANLEISLIPSVHTTYAFVPDVSNQWVVQNAEGPGDSQNHIPQWLNDAQRSLLLKP